MNAENVALVCYVGEIAARKSCDCMVKESHWAFAFNCLLTSPNKFCLFLNCATPVPGWLWQPGGACGVLGRQAEEGDLQVQGC